MRRTTLGPVSQSTLNARSSMGVASRNPRSSFKPSDDRRASALPLGRRSTANMQRPSGPRPSGPRPSTYGGTRLKRSDPRPLSDKSYMQACVKQLISFLIDRGYEQPISPKILTNPTSRDFQNIFLFLVRMLDPTFCFQRRFEDEIPLVLKVLGYPFPISKSALSAVGSPHTWPTLLAVLTWLLGLLQYDEELEKQNAAGDSVEPQAKRDAFFYENTVEAYDQFLGGLDEYPELDQQLDAHFATENSEREAEIEKLTSAVEQATETLHGLRSNPSALQLVTEERNSVQLSMKKFHQLIPSLQDHCSGLEKRLADKVAEIETEEDEVAEMEEEKICLTEMLARQEENAIDADRITSDRAMFKEALHKVTAERAKVEAEQKDVEQELSHASSQLNDVVKEYHRSFEMLSGGADIAEAYPDAKLKIPNGDCHISVSRDAALTDPAKILARDVDKEIVAPMKQLRAYLEAEIPSRQDESIQIHEEIDEVEEKLILLRHDLSLVKTKKEKLDSEYNSKRAAMNDLLKERSEDIMRKESEMDEQKGHIHETLREKERRLVQVKNQLRSFEDQFERERKRLGKILLNDFRLFRNHSGEVGARLLMVKDHFHQEMEGLGIAEK